MNERKMISWNQILLPFFLLHLAHTAGRQTLSIGGYTSYKVFKEKVNSTINNKTYEALNFILAHSSEESTGLMSYTTPDHILFFQLIYSVVKDQQILTNLLLETGHEMDKETNRRKKPIINFRDWLESKFNFVESDIYYFIKTIASGEAKGVNKVPKHLTELILVLDNKYKLFEKACTLGDTQTVKWFLESGYQSKDIPVKVLEDSFRKGNIEIVKVLLQFDLLRILNIPQAFLKGQYFESQTFLHVAAAGGLKDVVGYLLSKGTSINAKDAFGRTPLYKAVESNQGAIVKELIAARADVDFVYGESDNTIVHVAAMSKNMDSLKALLESGLSVNLVNNRGETPLHKAAKEFNHDVVSFLHKSRANVNSKDFFGNTPLHVASFAGNIESVRLLINLGAKLEERNNLGQIPLFKCVESGQREIIQEFVNRNPSLLEEKSAVGDTVLHIAAESGDLGILQMLLNLGASVNDKNNKQQMPLYRAALKGNIIAAKLLQNITDLRSTSSGLTMLHEAALDGNANAVKILVNSGIPADSVGLWDNTPLHIAAGLGFSDVVQTLLDLNANPNARNKNLLTPLHKAAIGGHLNVVELLINSHADAYKKDTNENTALDLAKAKNHTNLVEYLKKRLGLVA